MQGLVSGNDLLSFVLFLFSVAGGAVAVPMYVNGRVESLRREIVAAAEKRTEERERENARLWGEISRIQSSYVRQDHLDQRFTTIDGTLREIREDIRSLVRSLKPQGSD